MSRPPINPDKTAAGIALDPQTLERVIPESKRPDGTVRKQIKIRPGFTPQEDVRRFRGTKQAQMDANTMPKGHIIGWAPPPTSTAASGSAGSKALSKSAKKNAKRKEKRDKEKDDVPEDWDNDDDETSNKTTLSTPSSKEKDSKTTPSPPSDKPVPAPEKSKEGAVTDAADALSSKLEKLNVK
ncbi:hypothetical protein B0H34DRAFT_237665 [Crassisporium funariophilum]|nr:hypothetical protein B0H34DRAFT_237665 [Crassisporium funariophilum]